MTLDFFLQHRFQQVSMAMPLIFRAMTEQRDGLFLGEMLEETQREFLAVILYSFITPIDLARFTEFL